MVCRECNVILVSWNITRTKRHKIISEKFNVPWEFFLWHQPFLVKTSVVNRLYYFTANSFQKQKPPVTDTTGKLILTANLQCSTDFFFKLQSLERKKTETTTQPHITAVRRTFLRGTHCEKKRRSLHDGLHHNKQVCTYVYTAVHAEKRAAKIWKFQQIQPTSFLPNKDILRCRRYSKYIHSPCSI